MVSRISDFLSSTASLQEALQKTLQEMLQQIQLGEEDLLEQQEVLVSTALTESIDTLTVSRKAKSLASSAVMSHNFADGHTSESTDIDAHLAGLQAAKQLQNQADNRVMGLLNSLGGIQGPSLYGEVGSKGGIPEARIQLAMKRIKDADAYDASERNLEERKESIEARAAEATAPKDENGEPIENPASGEATPLPEISGATPASTPEAASSPAPEVPAAVPPALISFSTPVSELSLSATQASSIDCIV